jgi:hypothetical protein
LVGAFAALQIPKNERSPSATGRLAIRTCTKQSRGRAGRRTSGGVHAVFLGWVLQSAR